MTTSQDWWPADYGHYGAAVHPDELARRRHLPHRGRPRRWRRRRPALRPAQQLARQRQPRQGPPAAVAGQAEVRPEDLLGRPPGLRRQRAPSSRWASRRSASASGGRTSGSPRRSSGGRRTPGSATSATAATGSSTGPFGAVQMGLIYVNPEGPNGNPDPLAVRPGHPGDVPPDGDERRGDRRAHRRRPHVRQDATAPATPTWSAPSPRAAPSSTRASAGRTPSAAARAEDAITSGLEGAWTPTPTTLGQQLLRDPVRLRVGADREPGRRQAVEAEGRRRGGRRARRARPVGPARAR